MKPPSIALIIGIGLILLGLLAFPGGARAHEQETSVDWDVAYANIQVPIAPVYTYYATQTLPLSGSGTRTVIGQIGPTGYPTIAMNTGEYLVITWSFRYVGGAAVRGDLFWITRLGLDFSTIGRYVDNGDGTGRQWIGSASFGPTPQTRDNAALGGAAFPPALPPLPFGGAVPNTR